MERKLRTASIKPISSTIQVPVFLSSSLAFLVFSLNTIPAEEAPDGEPEIEEQGEPYERKERQLSKDMCRTNSPAFTQH